MLALRYVYVLALVVWLGGMVLLGALVAPTTFQVLQASEPVDGPRAGGRRVRRHPRRFHYVAYAAGGILLVTLAVMALLGPRPASLRGSQRASSCVMLGVALYSGFVVLRRVDAIQREVGRPALAAARRRRAAHRFDALHLLSTRLMMLNMAGALVLLYWEAREETITTQ